MNELTSLADVWQKPVESPGCNLFAEVKRNVFSIFWLFPLRRGHACCPLVGLQLAFPVCMLTLSDGSFSDLLLLSHTATTQIAGLELIIKGHICHSSKPHPTQTLCQLADLVWGTLEEPFKVSGPQFSLIKEPQ